MGKVYRFERFVLDVSRGSLRANDREIALRPKTFELLQYFVENSDRLIGKDELLRAVWPDVIVTDDSLKRCVSDVRAALSDEAQRIVRTVSRRGYMFTPMVSAGAGSAAGPDHAQPIHPPGPSVSKTPSIAILPFANLSGDPGQDYFVDGVTESLTTDLSRISGLFVIARNSAFSYKGKSIDVRQVGRELNIRYVLEGSVQRSGNRLRVNVQLVDAATANHLWAERFDKPVADLFDMQDEIVSRLANSLNAQLIEAEARRAEHSLHPDAMDLYFQGRAWYNKGYTPEHMAQAADFFERALALDPENIEALVGMAQVNMVGGANFSTDDRAALCSAAETNAIKALSLAPDHALAHLVLGVVYIFTNRAAQGIAECEQALALDRNLAEAHVWIGLAKVYLGRA